MYVLLICPREYNAHIYLSITTYFILILTSSRKIIKFVPAYFYPPCLTQTCFISCVSIFKIVFTELLKTEIRESFQILSFPLPQQLINNSCYFYLFHIPQQPSSSVITATVQILSLSIFYLAYCIGLLTGLCF